MKKTGKKETQIQTLQDRVDYMEGAYSKMLDYVSELASSREFNKNVVVTTDPLNILDTGLTYIKRRLLFEELAFYLIEEKDASFFMARCEPGSKSEKLRDEINQCIEDGTFAWALRQNHPIVVPSKVPEVKLVLHVLATQTRTRGMFVGAIKDENLKINDLSVTMLSITVQNIAYALENAMLYQMFRKSSEMRLNSAVEKLIENAHFLQTLIDAIPNPIFYKDIHGLYQGCNAAFETYLGMHKSKIVGKSVYDVAPRELADKYNAMDMELFNKGGLQVYESSVRYADGNIHDVIFNNATFTNADGSVGGLVGVMLDISERKEAERKMKQSLREKETLLREIHHRVKNNMAVVSSLLYLQANKINDDTVRSLFEESQQRVKAMALVHEKLYQTKDLSSINFRDYITSIVSEIVSLYRIDASAISMEVNVEDVELDLEAAIPCGLIINELLTNAFKYAFPDNRGGVLSVNLTKNDDLCTLTIKDNGVGLPEGFDYKEASTLGLQLVNVLTGQLNGNVQINFDKGTEAVVTFKTKRE